MTAIPSEVLAFLAGRYLCHAEVLATCSGGSPVFAAECHAVAALAVKELCAHGVTPGVASLAIEVDRVWDMIDRNWPGRVWDAETEWR